MAADSAINDGGVVMANLAPKIARNKHGDLAGACGTASYCDKFLDWFRNGEKGERPDPADDGGALVARHGGDLELYDKGGLSYLKVPYYALGSGYKVAIGAMWMGAGAEKAIECGIAHDVYTRSPIYVLKHDESP